MNERIKELITKSNGYWEHGDFNMPRTVCFDETDVEKFAELIVRECKENFSKVWYEQGMDIRGAEIGKFLTRFDEHFGVDSQ